MARPENLLECTSTRELYRGSRIRERRWEKGLSRQKMANLLGCHPDSLSNLEANAVNPSKQLLSKIAEMLEVPLEYFTKAPVHPRILRKKAAKFKLVGNGQTLKSGTQAKPTLMPTSAHPAMDIQDVLFSVTGKEVERLIASARLSEEEEKRVSVEVIEFTKRLLGLVETLRNSEEI